MGRLIREIALSRGHDIVAAIDTNNLDDFDSDKFASADIAIEFTRPDQAVANYHRAWKKGIPVVSGTTGWQTSAALDEVSEACANGATLFFAPNYSIGVNVTAAVNRQLAQLLAPFDQYSPSIHEIHHIHKLDHPSGTAIMLADDIIDCNSRIHTWAEPTTELSADGRVTITHERIDETPGTHIVKWDSPIDSITLTHEAKSRQGFALGAVIAAEWLVKQPTGKIYSMSDMLGF